MLKKKKKENTETADNLGEAVSNEGNLIDEPGLQNEEANVLSTEDLLKQELELANDKYLRLYAEFDNFRRRTIKEREEARKLEGKDLFVSLLPVIDDFERALKAMETATDIAPVKEGIILIQQKLKNSLTQKGLKEMVSIGSAFDPDIHEAITNIPAPSEDLKGKVVDEMEKGYYLNDKVIRFAKVIVGA